MKFLDNIGLGLFLFSIVSTILWSPRPYLSSHLKDDATNKTPKKEQFSVEKAQTIPLKTDFASKNTVGRMKIDFENGNDLYRNSLTRSNEENVKPTLNEISNWASIDEDPSVTQDHSNKPQEKSSQFKVATKEIRSGDLDASYITSNDFKDTNHRQTIEFYEQKTTPYDQSSHAHEVLDKSKLIAMSTIEKADDWVVDHTHEVFDKSSSIIDVAEQEVGKIMDTTIQEMDMKKPLKFLNNSASDIVGSSKENVCEDDLNESNILHNNLQVFGTNNIEDDVENTTSILHKNLRLLGVDNSDDFITENAHKNSEELMDQMSRDTGLNLIEQSFVEVNNLWSKLVDDPKINEVKHESNPPKGSHNSWNDQERIYDQNKNSYEDTKKHHREVNSQQHKHFQGDYEDDINYRGAKGRVLKYPYRIYEGAKVGTNIDYKTRKYIQHAKNHAHHHYRDGRHKISEVYKPLKDARRNFGNTHQYNEYEEDDNDEDFYEEL